MLSRALSEADGTGRAVYGLTMPTEIDWDPRRYKWEQLAEHIADRIKSGYYGPDFKLSEHDLIAEYGVARATVRHALQALRKQGLIVTVPAKGSFPIRQPPRSGDVLE